MLKRVTTGQLLNNINRKCIAVSIKQSKQIGLKLAMEAWCQNREDSITMVFGNTFLQVNV